MNSESRRSARATASAATTAMRRKAGTEADEVPPGVPGEDRREENREARRVEGVRGDRVTARGLELAGDEEPDSREEADRHLDRRRQPPVVDRVAQEKDRADRQEDSGDPREQLHADEALPVDARRRRRRTGVEDRGFFCSLAHRSGGVEGGGAAAASVICLEGRNDGGAKATGGTGNATGGAACSAAPLRAPPRGLLGPVFTFEEKSDRLRLRCDSRRRGRRAAEREQKDLSGLPLSSRATRSRRARRVPAATRRGRAPRVPRGTRAGSRRQGRVRRPPSGARGSGRRGASGSSPPKPIAGERRSTSRRDADRAFLVALDEVRDERPGDQARDERRRSRRAGTRSPCTSRSGPSARGPRRTRRSAAPAVASPSAKRGRARRRDDDVRSTTVTGKPTSVRSRRTRFITKTTGHERTCASAGGV